jgi:hypothetical protein
MLSCAVTLPSAASSGRPASDPMSRSPRSNWTLIGLLGLLVSLLATATLVPLAANAAPASRPAADALCDDGVAYWTLDETSGNRLDSRDGQDLIESTTVDYATGKIDNAASFAGGTNLYHDDSPTLETGDIDFTISAWVYFPSLPEDGTYSPIVSRLSSSAGEYQLFAYTGSSTTGFVFHVYKADGTLLSYASSATSIIPSSWNWVVAWYKASDNTVGMRVNNNSNYNSGYISGDSPGAADVLFLVGADERNSNSLEGRVDELGFWKRLLTTGEKNTLYNNGAGFDPITCGATPTPTLSPTPGALVEISDNYIQQGGFEFPNLTNSAWDVNITNSSVRLMLGMGLSPAPEQDANLWVKLADLGAGCETNAAVVLANSPPDDFWTGTVSQDFAWPGGSMYISFLAKTSANTKGNVTLLNEDDGVIIPVDPNFVNSTDNWFTARYVYNLMEGNYRLNISANGAGTQFGWMAVDDVNVRQGWWLNECNESAAPGLIPAQPAPNFPTPFPITPGAPPTEWLPWPAPGEIEGTATPLNNITVQVANPTPAPRDYQPGVNIIGNGGFQVILPFWRWSRSRWTQVLWPGGVEDLAYANLEMGLKPPALSQHFDIGTLESIFVSLWSYGDSHFTVAIREAPTGIFKAMWRIDTPPDTGWLEQRFLTLPLVAGHYSIEITNIYQKKAKVDEVCVTVKERCQYPVWYPGQADAETLARYAQQTAMANLATGYAIVSLTQTAQAGQIIGAQANYRATLTAQANAALTSTQNAAHRATATALSFWATANELAIENAAASATAQAQAMLWVTAQEATAQSVIATGQASVKTQTAVAAQTQLVDTAQQTVAAAQTQIYQTMNAPAALTQTAIAIIATAQAPWYATQTALAQQQQQLTATAQGTPAPTEDTALATQQALQVPNQPEPYWQAICGRPPNSLNLAWWMDYEVCRILSWFAWSPVNTVHVQTWLIELSHYEPFGMIQEVVNAFTTLRELVAAYDWNNTGADCANTDLSLTNLLPPATGILNGDFQFTPGDPIDMNCNIPIRSVVGDVIADGICGSLSILCQHGLLAWMQYLFDAMLILLFLQYIQAVWIEKATQG